jgi:hypothetical protein
MDHPAGVLGIGIITHNRRQALEHCVAGVLRHTTTPFCLVIADDGSDDDTVAWARSLGLLVITGPRSGVVWNKNRALHYFLSQTDCDPVALIEDDHWPVREGWDELWRDAVTRWHHVNLDRSTYTWNARWWASGEGTPEQPFFTNRVWGTGLTTRSALEQVGYLDSRFVGYGGGHGEWLRRFRTTYADEWGRRCPALDYGFLVTGALPSARNRAEMERNMALAGKLAEDSNEPIFRMAWRSEGERIQLEGEIRKGVDAYRASQPHTPTSEPPTNSKLSPPPIREEIVTSSLQAEGMLDLAEIAHLLTPLAAAAAGRMVIPNGPTVAVYSDGTSPVRTAIAIYSLVLNGYAPHSVKVFGEHRWSEGTKAFFQASLPFAEIPATEELRSAIRRAGDKALERMIAENDFGLRAAMALFVSNDEMCILEDDVVIIDGLDEGVNRLRTHDLVYAPANDKGRQFRMRWPTVRKLPTALIAADFGGGLYWLRPTSHPALIAEYILQLAVPSGGEPDSDWLNGLIALSYARYDVWKLPEHLHTNAATVSGDTHEQQAQLREKLLSYDYQHNPMRLCSICLDSPLRPLSDREALALVPSLFARSATRLAESPTRSLTLQAAKPRLKVGRSRFEPPSSKDGLTAATPGSRASASARDGTQLIGGSVQVRRSPIVATQDEPTSLHIPSAPRMSAGELELFDVVIADKKLVIEFGMGGSTLRLLQKSAAKVISVESDPRWSAAIAKTDLASESLARGRLVICPVDVGEVGSLGFPKDKSKADLWEEYWTAPWRGTDGDDPDLVFVDGRFRVACALNALLRGSASLTIMIHDFWARPHYQQALLKHIENVERADTLGVFVARKGLDRAQVAEDLAKVVKDPR